MPVIPPEELELPAQACSLTYLGQRENHHIPALQYFSKLREKNIQKESMQEATWNSNPQVPELSQMKK